MPNEEHVLEYSGALHLTRKLAVGGMATVYEAELLGPAGFALARFAATPVATSPPP